MAVNIAIWEISDTMEGMRGILKDSLRKTLHQLNEEDRVAAAWPVACGRALAERTSVVSFHDAVMRVDVADSAWLQQLITMRSHLKTEITRIAGVQVAEINFEVRRSFSRSAEVRAKE